LLSNEAFPLETSHGIEARHRNFRR
jgi:hypothetical protein